MKSIIFIIIFLMIGFQVSMADQNDPIECNLAIYCTNPSRGLSCGLLGDIEEDGKIEIIREYTGAIYSASHSTTTNGVLVRLQAKEGSYFSEKSGILSFESPSIGLQVANTSFYCKLK